MFEVFFLSKKLQILTSYYNQLQKNKNKLNPCRNQCYVFRVWEN